MRSYKDIFGFVGGALVCSFALGGINALVRYKYHDVNITTNDGRILTRVDGLFNVTDLCIKGDSMKFSRWDFWRGFREISDFNGDDIVDKIFIREGDFMMGGIEKSYNRDQQYAEFPKIFDQADIEFNKRIGQFSYLLEKK